MSVKFNKFLFYSFIMLFHFFAFTSAQAGIWVKKANMPSARVCVGVCSFEGKIYVVGGYDDGGKVLSTVEQYDPMTDTWKKLTDMKVARAYPSLVAMDGYLYAIGGENTSGCGDNVSSIERYDPTADKWRVLMPMPTLGITPVGVVDGKITAMGGLTAFQCKAEPTRSVEQYDPTIDRWEDKAKCLTERYFASACTVDNKIYVIGGMLGENGPSAKIIGITEMYDPALNKWVKKSDMSKARAILSVCALNGRIYSIGGVVGDSRRSMKATSIVEIYNPITDEWVKGTDMPSPRAGLGVCSLNDKIYVIGGGEVGNGEKPIKWGGALPTVEEYSPEGDYPVSNVGKLTATWGELRKIR